MIYFDKRNKRDGITRNKEEEKFWPKKKKEKTKTTTKYTKIFSSVIFVSSIIFFFGLLLQSISSFYFRLGSKSFIHNIIYIMPPFDFINGWMG